MGLGESLALITPSIINQFGNTVTLQTINTAKNEHLEYTNTVTSTSTAKAIIDDYSRRERVKGSGGDFQTSSLTMFTFFDVTVNTHVVYLGKTYKFINVTPHPISDVTVLYVVTIAEVL